MAGDDHVHQRVTNGCGSPDDSVRLKNGNGILSTNGNHHKGLNGGGDALACKAALQPYEEDPDSICGLWFFKPRWLQRFANKKAFLAVFCLTSVLQGMYYTYFVSVLTTIEKLYQIPSKTTGIIMSATEIGQIGGALLLTYYGGQGHRPKWIACGMLIFAVASILCAMPHFLFIDTSLSVTSLARAKNAQNATVASQWAKLCHSSDMVAPLGGNFTDATAPLSTSPATSLLTTTSPFSSTSFLVDGGGGAVADALRQVVPCDISSKPLSQSRITHVVLSVFFISLLLIGIGATAVYTLGIPYIDDNVANRESPLYFGITIGVRIFGPVFGFLLGSYCTSVYVNFPFETSNLSPGDPHWIGAWWLGVFIVGAALIVTALPMMAFPRNLPQRRSLAQLRALRPGSDQHRNGMVCLKHQQALQQKVPLINSPPSSPSGHKKPVKEKPALRDFPSAIRRLLKNEILLYRTASSVLHILPIAGLYTFLPKYLESQFRLTETKANMITGFAGILVMGVGIFASGTFMRKYKPNARFVAKWIAFCALAYSIGMVILMWVGCPLGEYVGLNSEHKGLDFLPPACNSSCDCKSGLFSPVCHNSVTYLSPCLAGCSQVLGTDQQPTFNSCHCTGTNDTISNGFCSLECNNLVWYIIIFSFFVLIHSTSEVGSMLLTLRCVESHDKALALGLIQFAIGLFGNVPCPIIYGAVVDSACLFWEDNCGEPGACRVYDPSKFRMVFHGVTAIIMFVAFLVDAVVWYKASSIHIHEEEDTRDASNDAPPVVPGALPQAPAESESCV